MSKQMQSCYMCSSPRVSDEHIPPKSFFPNIPELRKNLITVPSCDKHNTEKSDDDLYILLIISAQMNVNQLGLEHFNKSVLPKIQKKPYLIKAYNKNARPILLDGQETFQFEVDRDRFNKFFDYMVRGLYFYNLSEKWLEPILIEPLNIVRGSNDLEINQHQIIQRDMRSKLMKLLDNKRKFGDNPEVFYYQYHHEEPYGYIFHIVLYEKFQVIAFSQRALANL